MKNTTKRTLALTAMLLGTGLTSPLVTQATDFTPPPARQQSAPVQQNFNWQHEFHSGMNFRQDLGQPTAFNGQVVQDPFRANVRRDANVSNVPPAPRGGATITTNDPANWAFRTQQNNLQQQGFWDVTTSQPTNGLPHFDLAQTGINAPVTASPASVNNQGVIHTGGGGGFLPSTSIN